MQTTMPTFLEQLNSSQREAVTHKTGPLLIIAGPGSGKTRTVVHSIAYAIENGVMPDRILAFSFTVKASEELRHRVAEYVGQDKSSSVWISTFHRFCRKVLREDIEALDIDYTRDFKALEENDQRKVVQAQINYLQHHDFAKSDDVLNFIAKCKAMDICPSEAGNYAPDPNKSQVYVEIYERYEKHLKEEGAIDYENQQLFTDALFKKVPEVKAKWQDRFDLIFIDEYQDTDSVQYRIIKTLAEKRRNLRVVGDDDQGIYGFRGADIQNILHFEKDYPDAKVITLEQNYRSTQQIVKASTAIADFNPDRREKELFTTNAEGEKVKHLHCTNNEEEAFIIADFINRAIQESWSFRDFAILCRTSWQANAFKTAFTDLEIPFHMFGESIDPSKDVVSIMTIHKSKGLEFPNVFVTGVCTGLLPHYRANEKEWDEELRLLYVAMTRAKNWLCLSSYDSDDSQFQRKPSQFLDYIPPNSLESVNTLHHTSIPPTPEERVVPIVPEESPLPVQSESDMTVLGIDPGVSNVGWAITQKTVDGYTVHKYDTERPSGKPNDKLRQIEHKINALVVSNSPDAIAVEKLEGATGEWFRYVAGCVAMIRRIADRHDDIECHLYTPQQVKAVATEDRNASKLDVQSAVQRICNLQEIPCDHPADAIAVSLCYLRSYLNSSRFQGNTRRREHYNRGHTHLDDGQYDAAVTEFRRAINIDPITAEVHCNLGRAYLGQGNLEAAESAANRTLRLESNYLPAHQLLEQIKRAYYDQGLAHLNNKRYEEAIVQFKETINRYSNFTAAYCGLAHAYLGQGSLGEAENAAKTALRLENNHPSARDFLERIKQAYYDRGLSHLNNEQYDEAIAQFKGAINIAPIFKEAYCGLGRTYLSKDDYDYAIVNYTKAIKLNPNSAHSYHGRADAYYAKDDYAHAITDYTKVIELNPNSAQAYHRRAYAYYAKDDYNHAITDYTKAIELNPNSAHSYSGRGAAYAKIGDHTRKKEDYATAKLLESAS